MPELVIGGILLAPIVVAIIQAAKSLGLETKYAPWLNAVLSTAGYGLMVFIAQRPDLLEPVTIGLNGLMVFLLAAGFYDRVQGIIVKE